MRYVVFIISGICWFFNLGWSDVPVDGVEHWPTGICEREWQYISGDEPSGVSSSTVEALIEEAVAQWNGAETGINFTKSSAGPFFWFWDNLNDDTEWGRTTLRLLPSTTTIVDISTTLNNTIKHTWVFNKPDPVGTGNLDAFTVILHEWGHWYSLDDTYDLFLRCLVMYGYLHEGESKRKLRVGDVTSARWMYSDKVTGGGKNYNGFCTDYPGGDTLCRPNLGVCTPYEDVKAPGGLYVEAGLLPYEERIIRWHLPQSPTKIIKQEIQYTKNIGFENILPRDITSIIVDRNVREDTIKGLEPCSYYSFRVKAISELHDTSEWSTEAITFTAPQPEVHPHRYGYKIYWRYDTTESGPFDLTPLLREATDGPRGWNNINAGIKFTEHPEASCTWSWGCTCPTHVDHLPISRKL